MEKILQYAWKWRLYGNSDLRLADGRRFRILDPGSLNQGAGPDFFNAKIELDGFEWAGNVELHIRASDWWRHGHHLDERYSGIILHVVTVDDARLTRPDGREIPQFVFPLTPGTTELYMRLTADASQPPPVRCFHRLSDIPGLLLTDAMTSAAFERLVQKGRHILEVLRRLDGDAAHTCVVAVARALGFGVNAEPLERTAMALNLNYCARHADDPMQLDALVLGQSGLLSAAPPKPDEYFSRLRDEFAYLSHKYGIKPLPASIWTRGGVRPANSPYRRLAYLARLLPGCHSLLSRIMAVCPDVDALCSLFNVEFDGYWAEHYSFGPASGRDASVALGPDSVRLLLVNAVAPLVYAMGVLEGRRELEEQAVGILEALPPENNTYMRDWRRAGIKPGNAFFSQGLLQLRKMYCDCNECLRCRIGNRLMRAEALPALPVAAH